MSSLASPDNESFSTPPTTPGFPLRDSEALAPSFFRRTSRPSSLQIKSGHAASDVVIEGTSPELNKRANGNTLLSGSPGTYADTSHQNLLSPIDPHRPARSLDMSLHSPCFVHSHLDKGASLNDWLHSRHQSNDPNLGVARSLLQPSDTKPDTPQRAMPTHLADDDDAVGGSLTEQLAETAVGVREMSKQLGRARVLSNIQNVLIITKARDNRLIKLTRQLALYLMLKQRKGQERGLVVYVDSQLRHSRRFDAEGIAQDYPQLMAPFPRRRSSSSNSLSSMSSSSAHKDEYIGQEGQLRYWTHDMCSRSPHLFDFVVTLGGDGTVLFTSWLFQRIVPPVLSFALGSLGFLTNFDFADHEGVMDSVIDTGIRVNLRMRFTCTVYRAVSRTKGNERKAVKKGETGEIMMKNVEKGGWEALEGGWSGTSSADGLKGAKDKEIMCFTTRPVEKFEVLNDLVVDRGPSPYVSLLELFGDEHHMTTVQADGLTVSTPTGSTAYSLSAGGSLVHPEIPALLITPICPHTLSFRPMLLPDTMELRICVPFNSRSTAWASFDGRGRVELKQGDHIKVVASKYPFPTVCADKQSTDWFHAISRTLKWNERERQKSFVVVEEGPAKPKSTKLKGTGETSPPEDNEELDEEDEVSEEEDDKFDIDDSSPEAAEAKRMANQGRSQSRKRSKSRSRSRSSGIRSGVNTPGRFANSQSHPPAMALRHVNFADAHSESSSSIDSLVSNAAQHFTQDDSHASRSLGGKGRMLRDRDLESENIKTPTVANSKPRTLHHSLANELQVPRAFAVWGQDESDSNASDSDA